MSEDDIVLSGQTGTGALVAGSLTDFGGAASQTTAGSLLREARQAQGLDIDALAALLKVPVKKLQALEQDEFELLLDPVFARALASSVCRILKIDPAPVLQRLPVIAAFKVTSQNRGINAPFRAREGGHGASARFPISRPAILIGLALLVGAVALFFLPVIQQEITRYRQAGSAVERKSELIEPVSISTPAVSPAASESGAAELARNPPREMPPTVTVQPSLSVSNASEVNAKAMITFSATGDSWVKVTDAKGTVVLERMLRTGESAEASGALPLAAVVGRADAIQVQVRGQAFGLGGVTRSNVARFEVK
ncbi:MAG: RodZ domain-containing protein [Polaromonas sp.]